MIEKIRGSLWAKIFSITSLMLIVCCVITYSFIAWLVPKSYRAELSGVLEQNVQLKSKTQA